MNDGAAPAPRRAVDPAAAKAAREIGELKRALGGLGEVRTPAECDPPILAASVRSWLFSWLGELRAAEDLAAVGLKPRLSAVLHGPPGCGKTTLAHHLAARLGIPMVVVGPETIMSPFLGESEQNVGKLFDALREYGRPTLLFLDEMEAIGAKRGSGKSDGGARSSVLTVLLRKVEEFRGYLIGATNRADILDPALWRRFHMQVAIEFPGADERFAIIARYLTPFELAEADLDLLVELTDGASPALLRGVIEGVKRALVLAPRLNRPADDPMLVFYAIIATVRPPPDTALPPLWAAGGVQALAALSWPPIRVPSAPAMAD